MKKKVERPNVIVFFTDQQRWDSTGVHGNPLGLTPNFDAMAAGGTHAFNAFTCQPVCGPARSCLQTGLYATVTGCCRNGMIPQPGQQMLGHYFRQAGYSTGYIGKWHLADRDPVPVGQRGGYQHWLAANLMEFSSDSYRCEVFDSKGKRVRLPGYRVDGLTDAAIRFVETNQKDPFFLFLSFLEPHRPARISPSHDQYPSLSYLPPPGPRISLPCPAAPPLTAYPKAMAHLVVRASILSGRPFVNGYRIVMSRLRDESPAGLPPPAPCGPSADAANLAARRHESLPRQGC